MDSSNAEKAAALEWLGEYHGSIDSTALMLAHRAGQRIGRASRDAEVAELTSRLRWDVAAARVEAFTTESDTFRARGEALVKQISEVRAALGDSEARRAELEAAIQAVRDLADKAEHGALRWADPLPVPEWVPRVRSVLSEPSVVLEDRDREVAARTLEDAEQIARDEIEIWATSNTHPRIAAETIAIRIAERAAAMRKGDE